MREQLYFHFCQLSLAIWYTQVVAKGAQQQKQTPQAQLCSAFFDQPGPAQIPFAGGALFLSADAARGSTAKRGHGSSTPAPPGNDLFHLMKGCWRLNAAIGTADAPAAVLVISEKPGRRAAKRANFQLYGRGLVLEGFGFGVTFHKLDTPAS